ncbi:zinc finger SWIM domain-containing protein 7 isoform X1 [Lacerta agilis]|uniref:zinc finger SWIM domain-containing protein 7 isoform X1 n=1 Tax=Lacerta agilis TaxID=80427 RepID=UPI00141A5189|nr:zinc finger SWIM domain-containing protein 7 isoform X1 [Lacerta agilis]
MKLALLSFNNNLVCVFVFLPREKTARLIHSRDGCHFASLSGRTVERDRKGFLRDISRLKFIFGASAVPALDLVDRQSVTRITSPSGRRVYQVVGSSGKHYTCYASCHFCSCPAFTFSVLRKGDSLVCKHLLAVYLSQALGSCQELTVPDKQLTRLLLQEEEEEER